MSSTAQAVLLRSIIIAVILLLFSNEIFSLQKRPDTDYRHITGNWNLFRFSGNAQAP